MAKLVINPFASKFFFLKYNIISLGFSVTGLDFATYERGFVGFSFAQSFGFYIKVEEVIFR